ncbi:MAG: hypothetical protein OXD34_15390 [bacterium]|nr:hypothetical protein [bacterium]
MDYAVVVGLFGISTAITWRVVFVFYRGIEKSLEEFKTVTNDRFDRQDRVIKEGFARQDARFEKQDARFDRQDRVIKEGFDRQERRLDKQGERLDSQGALILRLVREVGLLTGALIGTPGKEREKVGSRRE